MLIALCITEALKAEIQSSVVTHLWKVEKSFFADSTMNTFRSFHHSIEN